MDSTMPSYYIYRDGAATEPFDPTAPLQFFPPKDSDELFFALREAFPTVSTHSERMRNAVIEFLMSEGQTQRAAPQPTPMLPMEHSFNSTSTSPYSPYISMTSSTSSSSGSPSAYESQSPRVVTSPSVAGESSQTAAARARPALEQMTSVFSLSSHSKPKLRSRRKMTEAEKVEYRKRRSAGACTVCSAQKRKCKHTKDLARTESSASASASTNRVGKPVTQRSRGKQPQVQPAATIQPPSLPPPSSQPPPLDHFSLLDFGEQGSLDLLSFENDLFPWQTDSDWTLLDTPSADHTFTHMSPQPLASSQNRTYGSLHESHPTRDMLGDGLFDLFTDNFGGSTDGLTPSSGSGLSMPSHSSYSQASRPAYSHFEPQQSHGLGPLALEQTAPVSFSAPSAVSIAGGNTSSHTDTTTVPITFAPLQRASASQQSGLYGQGSPLATSPSPASAAPLQSRSSQTSPESSPSLSASGNDPVAAASVKDRQSHTLRDSGQAVSPAASPAISSSEFARPARLRASAPAFSQPSAASPSASATAAGDLLEALSRHTAPQSQTQPLSRSLFVPSVQQAGQDKTKAKPRGPHAPQLQVLPKEVQQSNGPLSARQSLSAPGSFSQEGLVLPRQAPSLLQVQTPTLLQTRPAIGQDGSAKASSPSQTSVLPAVHHAQAHLPGVPASSEAHQVSREPSDNAALHVASFIRLVGQTQWSMLYAMCASVEALAPETTYHVSAPTTGMVEDCCGPVLAPAVAAC